LYLNKKPPILYSYNTTWQFKSKEILAIFDNGNINIMFIGEIKIIHRSY